MYKWIKVLFLFTLLCSVLVISGCSIFDTSVESNNSNIESIFEK